jgi:hypothetical protein
MLLSDLRGSGNWSVVPLIMSPKTRHSDDVIVPTLSRMESIDSIDRTSIEYAVKLFDFNVEPITDASPRW